MKGNFWQYMVVYLLTGFVFLAGISFEPQGSFIQTLIWIGGLLAITGAVWGWYFYQS